MSELQQSEGPECAKSQPLTSLLNLEVLQMLSPFLTSLELPSLHATVGRSIMPAALAASAEAGFKVACAVAVLLA